MSDFEEIKVIPTDNIGISDLPSGKINWEKFSKFAQTFDPRAENLTSDELIEISGDVPKIDHDIKILRAFLYNWQRIYNNKTYEPSVEFLLKASQVIEWIRARVVNSRL